MRKSYPNNYQNFIKKSLYKIMKINAVFDSEDQEYTTLATCINEKGKIETISIENFDIQGDIDCLEGSFIELEENDDEELKGFIFINE